MRKLRKTPLKKVIGSRKATTLHALVETDIRRTTWQVEREGGQAEIALDQGVVRARDREASISEIEIESKGGDPAIVFELAKAVAAVTPARLAGLSKSERGYALMNETDWSVSKADDMRLGCGLSVGEGFRVLIYACLKHYHQNEPILLERRQSDALHQCRVALRRLRAVLSLFKALTANSQGQAIKAQLKDLSRAFGRTRDLDVFLAGPVAASKEREEPGAADFAAQAEFAREEAYDALIGHLRGVEGRTLLIDIVQWVETGQWQQSSAARCRLIAFGRKQLSKSRIRVLKNIRNLASLPDDERHMARIQAKRLRYAAELLGTVYRKSGRKRFIKRCEKLQSELGALHDIVAAEALAGRLAAVERAATTASQQGWIGFAAGRIVGRGESRAPILLRAAEQAAEAFRGTRSFW